MASADSYDPHTLQPFRTSVKTAIKLDERRTWPLMTKQCSQDTIRDDGLSYSDAQTSHTYPYVWDMQKNTEERGEVATG